MIISFNENMARIKDIPKFDRPREKFLEKGQDALTDSELLAILIGGLVDF